MLKKPKLCRMAETLFEFKETLEEMAEDELELYNQPPANESTPESWHRERAAKFYRLAEKMEQLKETIEWFSNNF